MARGKNLSFRMKNYVSHNMDKNPDDYLYTKNTSNELVLVNKNNPKDTIIINKKERNITTF